MKEKLTKIDEKIQKQEEEIKKLKALKRKEESRLRAKEKERERKDDTRRKILIGACMMKLAEDNPEANDRMLRALDKFLVSERDRALFDFESKNDGTGEQTQPKITDSMEALIKKPSNSIDAFIKKPL